MNLKKISISLLLLSASTASISNELLSTVLIKLEGIDIGFVLDGDAHKIFSITEEEILKKSAEMDRKKIINHFILYSDKPTISTMNQSQGNQGSTNLGAGMTPLLQQIYQDDDYIEHHEHGAGIVPSEERAFHPPNHGGGVFRASGSSTSARLLAAEVCDQYLYDHIYIGLGFDELVPYFHEDTTFSEMTEVDFSDFLAPKLLASHGEPDYIIDFTLNFKCAYKIGKIRL